VKPITTTAKFFLVQKMQISNKDALMIIAEKKLLINGKPAGVLQKIGPADKVELEGRILKEPKNLQYIILNKPRGIECTLNRNIPCNLFDIISLDEAVVPVGRLDKESEGLLFLTNDGYLIAKIIHKENEQEKEYEVSVDKPVSDEALEKLSQGVTVLGQKTLPATVVRTGKDSFRITLIQGLNRQIRRMCYKLNYEVTSLRRIRIVNIHLGDLKPGEFRQLDRDEIQTLNFHLNRSVNSGDVLA
jgi:23S rRNA pseudouridine2604 synthase